MDILKFKDELKKKAIFDIPLRVVFYARVSTDSDEQLNSLDNQTSYYKDLIMGNKNWTYVGGYIDEGISAISTKNRINFLRMIDDAKEDKFDLIITKELSRFARNLLDSIQYTRELANNGVCVYFQNDNIKTFDDDSELRLGIMASIAQDELRKLSSRIKFGHQEATRKGVVLGNSRIFGYKKLDGRLVIDEEEAEMIRTIFELYATDNYSMRQIENILWDKGYRNHNGNKISHTTLSNTISNPKYKGYFVANKVKIVDMFTKKQKFLPPEDWVMYKDETGEVVPAIVSEELWDRANEVLTRRSEDVKNRKNKCNHANLLTGKLYCTHCGAAYYRTDATYKGKKTSKWRCSNKIKNGASCCPSFSIDEREITKVIADVFIKTHDKANEYIDRFLKDFKENCFQDYSSEIKKLNDKIENAEKKKDKLLQYNVDGKISDSDFIKLCDKCNTEIQEAKELILEYSQADEKYKSMVSELNEIKHQLVEAAANIKDGVEITPAFINKYIDLIYVTPESDTEMSLVIKLFSKETIKKSYSRTGQMSLTI